MYDISQKYGVDLCILQGRNRLSELVQPQAGQLIKLKGRRVKYPPSIYTDQPQDKDKPEKEKEPFLDPDIFLPFEIEAPEDTSTVDKEEAPIPVLYHTVEKEDTLWSIARRYSTTVEVLKELNSLSDNNIRRGMALKVR